MQGMLGLVRIFASEGPWDGGREQEQESRRYGRSDYGVAPEDFEILTEELCQPSWDVARPVELQCTLTLRPFQTRGVYLHSALPDDLGIQYSGHQRRRQLQRDTPVAENDHLLVTPGLGHTSCHPFDVNRGWCVIE